MTMLVVDFSQLQGAIDHMAQFQREVAGCLEDVEHTQAALHGSWHGSGSDAQAQAQQQWEDGAEQMKAALEQLRKIVDTARTNYIDAVAKNGQMWG
jgi:WXG100 family type VII secretion target